MPTVVSDRWLWLGCGVCLFFGVKLVGWQLQSLVDAQNAGVSGRTTKPKKKSINQDAVAERAIPLDVLEKLIHSPSYEIRESAISILVAQFLASKPAMRLLADEYLSTDTERKDVAERVTEFLGLTNAALFRGSRGGAGQAFADDLMEDVPAVDPEELITFQEALAEIEPLQGMNLTDEVMATIEGTVIRAPEITQPIRTPVELGIEDATFSWLDSDAPPGVLERRRRFSPDEAEERWRRRETTAMVLHDTNDD